MTWDRPTFLPTSRSAGNRILYVGRLVYDKGVQYLLEALANLSSEYSLRIAGDGWYRTKLEAKCQRLGLSQCSGLDIDRFGLKP